MDMYIVSKIDGWTFCNEFYYSYSLEISDKILTDLEKNVFSELDKVSSRFSKFEKDHKEFPGAYFTEDQLHKKILESKEKLKEENPLEKD